MLTIYSPQARAKEHLGEQEAALAAELGRRKREKERVEREMQRICEEDPSLRELQGKVSKSATRMHAILVTCTEYYPP